MPLLDSSVKSSFVDIKSCQYLMYMLNKRSYRIFNQKIWTSRKMKFQLLKILAALSMSIQSSDVGLSFTWTGRYVTRKYHKSRIKGLINFNVLIIVTK